MVRPDEGAALRLRFMEERARLRDRFGQEARERSERLRTREAMILPLLRASPSAGGQLLVAEIELARQRHTHWLLVQRWEASSRQSPRPQPYFEPVIEALERVGKLAPDRLTRDRAAQLLAVVHADNGDRSAAIRVLSAALQRRVSWELRAELRSRLADLLLSEGRFAGAAREYGALEGSDGSWFVRGQLGLAWCRYRLGDLDGAERAVREVRQRLDGTFDSAAVALLAEADHLYTQLLADQPRKLPSGLKPRIREAVTMLRARHATLKVGSTPAAPGRLRRLQKRVGKLRACYRDWLRSAGARGANEVGGVIALTPGRGASLVRLDDTAPALSRCLQRVLDRVRTPRRHAPTVLALELIPVDAAQ